MKIIDHINQNFTNSTFSILDEKTLSADQGPVLDLENKYE